MAGTNLGTKVTSTLKVHLTENVTVNGGKQLALFATCTGTPPTTANVFAAGCLMNQLDATLGVCSLYNNIGTAAAPNWALMALD